MGVHPSARSGQRRLVGSQSREAEVDGAPDRGRQKPARGAGSEPFVIVLPSRVKANLPHDVARCSVCLDAKGRLLPRDEQRQQHDDHLYVGNLDDRVTARELEYEFCVFGALRRA